ncbi:MAG: PaaI family thioesterase [Alphaproteobacteria bacterium]|nr:PaaI family thioesterase [Alphaproteobacteria bacterium]
MAAGVPAGFAPLSVDGGFVGHNGPFYLRAEDSGGSVFGFRAEPRHGNFYGVLHGGALVTLVDTYMGHLVAKATGQTCATMTFDAQFVAGGRVGRWIEARGEIKKLTRSHAHLVAEARDGEETLLLASAVFRVLGGPRPEAGAA